MLRCERLLLHFELQQQNHAFVSNVHSAFFRSPGWFFDYTQSYDLAFYFSGGIVVLGSFILFLLTLPCCNRRPSTGDRPDVHYTSNCDKVASVAWRLITRAETPAWWRLYSTPDPPGSWLDYKRGGLVPPKPLTLAARVLYAKIFWRFQTVPWVHFSGSKLQAAHLFFSYYSLFREVKRILFKNGPNSTLPFVCCCLPLYCSAGKKQSVIHGTRKK